MSFSFAVSIIYLFISIYPLLCIYSFKSIYSPPSFFGVSPFNLRLVYAFSSSYSNYKLVLSPAVPLPRVTNS